MVVGVNVTSNWLRLLRETHCPIKHQVDGVLPCSLDQHLLQFGKVQCWLVENKSSHPLDNATFIGEEHLKRIYKVQKLAAPRVAHEPLSG